MYGKSRGAKICAEMLLGVFGNSFYSWENILVQFQQMLNAIKSEKNYLAQGWSHFFMMGQI
jgi:hypothetical protein